MITRNDKAKFKNSQILLDSVCSSTIIMGIIINKRTHLKDAAMQRHTQVGKITTNLKVKIYFTLPELSATKIVMWDCHVDDSAKVGYDIILGRDLLSVLGLNI